MLNMFLKNRGAECFATIDLLEIDMHTGTASFIKSGAAPSYIVRGGNLFRIASGTLPVGILSDISAEVTEFELMEGDIIVMVSDGVCGDPELDGVRLCECLTNDPVRDLAASAEKIMLGAKAENRRSDDMTIELLRIEPPAKNSRDRVPSSPELFSQLNEDFAV